MYQPFYMSTKYASSVCYSQDFCPCGPRSKRFSSADTKMTFSTTERQHPASPPHAPRRQGKHCRIKWPKEVPPRQPIATAEIPNEPPEACPRRHTECQQIMHIDREPKPSKQSANSHSPWIVLSLAWLGCFYLIDNVDYFLIVRFYLVALSRYLSLSTFLCTFNSHVIRHNCKHGNTARQWSWTLVAS